MMLSTAQALHRILALMRVTGSEIVPLRRASGRILAAALCATRAQPPFPASAMDGYALRSTDITAGAVLAVIGESRAGKGFDGKIGQGQAVRIFTGAPVPAGADRVLIQEDAEAAGPSITIRADRDQSAHIRPSGSDFAAGQTLVHPKRLTAADIALLAAMNIAEIPVRRRPVVALIATGDELVMPGESPGPDQITSSNNLGLAALLEQFGADIRLLPIARDTSASLQAAFVLAQAADLIVTLGGASVGEHDLVQESARANGLTLDFWKVAMRPGKPLIAGKMGDTPLIGLPGNPVSAMVCGHIFLRPAIDAMLGLPAGPLPRLTGTLAAAIPANGPREHYARGQATQPETGWLLRVEPNQDSALLSVLARSNALIIQPPGQPAQAAGSRAAFILI